MPFAAAIRGTCRESSHLSDRLRLLGLRLAEADRGDGQNHAADPVPGTRKTHHYRRGRRVATGWIWARQTIPPAPRALGCGPDCPCRAGQPWISPCKKRQNRAARGRPQTQRGHRSCPHRPGQTQIEPATVYSNVPRIQRSLGWREVQPLRKNRISSGRGRAFSCQPQTAPRSWRRPPRARGLFQKPCG